VGRSAVRVDPGLQGLQGSRRRQLLPAHSERPRHQPLTPNGPVTSPIFADTGADNLASPGLINGQTYNHAVTAVYLGPDNLESAAATAYARPVPGPDLVLSGLPVGTITGTVALYPLTDTGDAPAAQLLADGVVVASSAVQTNLDSSVGQSVCNLDTTCLANGAHVIQLVGPSGEERSSVTCRKDIGRGKR
jgi:hypothetical protein